MKIELPSDKAEDILAEANNILKSINEMNESNELSFIMKEEKMTTAKALFELINQLKDSIDTYNKETLRQHCDLLQSYGDMIPTDRKKIYIDEIMKHSII